MSTTLLYAGILSGLIGCMLSQLLSVPMSNCAVVSGKHRFRGRHPLCLALHSTPSSAMIPEPWGDEVCYTSHFVLGIPKSRILCILSSQSSLC